MTLHIFTVRSITSGLWKDPPDNPRPLRARLELQEVIHNLHCKSFLHAPSGTASSRHILILYGRIRARLLGGSLAFHPHSPPCKRWWGPITTGPPARDFPLGLICLTCKIRNWMVFSDSMRSFQAPTPIFQAPLLFWRLQNNVSRLFTSHTAQNTGWLSPHNSEPTSYTAAGVKGILPSCDFYSLCCENKRYFWCFPKHEHHNVRSAFSSNAAPFTPLEELGELSQAVVSRSLSTSLLGISVLKSLKDIDYLLYHGRVLLLFVLIATVWCQFSDKKRECCWGCIYNMSLKAECRLLWARNWQVSSRLKTKGHPQACVCTHTHTAHT